MREHLFLAKGGHEQEELSPLWLTPSVSETYMSFTSTKRWHAAGCMGIPINVRSRPVCHVPELRLLAHQLPDLLLEMFLELVVP